jgi:hypothetical protein
MKKDARKSPLQRIATAAVADKWVATPFYSAATYRVLPSASLMWLCTPVPLLPVRLATVAYG